MLLVLYSTAGLLGGSRICTQMGQAGDDGRVIWMTGGERRA